MQRITKYQSSSDGSYKAIVEGVQLGNTETLSLDNGYAIPIDIDILDGREISSKQRKKIFALINDIHNFTGQEHEDLRRTFQFYLEMIKGYDTISLKNCTMTVARELIDLIINWTFVHNIPLNYKTSHLLREDKAFLYASTLNRKCVICGKHADLAHRKAVGAGRNRNTIDHYGSHVLGLCREHHTIQHQMGVDSFDKHYHLIDSWLAVDDRLNNMLKGQAYKNEKEIKQ